MAAGQHSIDNPLFLLKKAGKRCEIIFAALLFASFFIPWVKVGGLFYYSGYVIPDALFTLAQFFEASSGNKSGILIMAYVSYSLYLIPFLSIIIIVMSIYNFNLRIVSILVGVVPFIALFYAIIEFGNIFNNLCAGFYLTIFASLSLAISVYIKSCRKNIQK